MSTLGTITFKDGTTEDEDGNTIDCVRADPSTLRVKKPKKQISQIELKNDTKFAILQLQVGSQTQGNYFTPVEPHNGHQDHINVINSRPMTLRSVLDPNNGGNPQLVDLELKNRPPCPHAAEGEVGTLNAHVEIIIDC